MNGNAYIRHSINYYLNGTYDGRAFSVVSRFLRIHFFLKKKLRVPDAMWTFNFSRRKSSGEFPCFAFNFLPVWHCHL